MNPEHNKQFVRHIMEDGFNKQDLSVIDASFHEDYVRRGYGMKDAASLAEHRADLIAQHEAIDSAKFTIQEMLAEGDMVADGKVAEGSVIAADAQA